MSENIDIDEFLSATENSNGNFDLKPSQGVLATPPTNVLSQQTRNGDTVQWGLLSDGKFYGTGQTIKILEPGAYQPFFDDRYGICLESKRILNDEIVRLPDTASDKVLKSIQSFWTRRDQFVRRGHLFKRGIMLWGAPGSGKTVTISLLCQDIISRGGIVIFVNNPNLATQALGLIRRIELERKIICVMEDIDEILREFSEHNLLSLLDGENQINDVVHIATTNYPELLPSRLVNRPSRFDEIIKIGMPTTEARRVYLRSKLSTDEISDENLMTWLTDTDGFSIAHLRELIIAIFCLGREYGETIQRLKAMANKIKSESEINVGFKK